MSGYLQITTRCNMLCEHCCFSCTAQGEDMTLETFRRSLEYLRDTLNDSTMTIGGGEPTVHPKFREIMESLRVQGYFGCSDDYGDDIAQVHIITNGKKVADALYLAKLAFRGEISCNLSQDPYHDPISQRVIDAFSKRNYPDAWNYENDPYEGRIYVGDDYYIDRRGVNDGAAKNGVDLVGRAATSAMVVPNVYRMLSDHLCCSGPFIKPDGTIQACSCEDHPKVWNVWDNYPDEFAAEMINDGHCYHDIEERRQEELDFEAAG